MRRARLTTTVGLALVAALLIPATGSQASQPTSRASDPSTSPTFGYRSPYEHRAPQASDKVSGTDATQSGATDSAAQAPQPTCPAICLPVEFPTMEDPDAKSPGDPTGAGGDSHVVAAVNVSVAVYDKTGAEEVAPIRLDDLVSTPLHDFFDPRVVFDQYSDQYVLVFVGVDFATQESEIYVVSIPDATADNPATWCAREIVGDQSPGNGKQWADYPGLGYDQSRVYVSANMFDFVGAGGEGTQVIALDKAGLFDCIAPVTSHVFTTDDVRLKDGRKIWSVMPAATEGAAVEPEYALATDYHCPGGDCHGNLLVICRFDGTEFKARTIKVREFKMPAATQKGTPLNQPQAYWDAGDLRFDNASYDSDTNRIYAAHAVRKNVERSDGWVESVAKWYEVEPGSPLGDSMVTRKGIVGTSKKDAGWPVIATDDVGNIWVNYSRASGASGAKEFLGAWVAVIPAGTRNPSEIRLIAAGSSLYAPFPGEQRWGDFNAINRDPADGGLMWLVNQRAATLNRFEQVVAAAENL